MNQRPLTYATLTMLLCSAPALISPRKLRLWLVTCCRTVIADAGRLTTLIDMPAWFHASNLAAWERSIACAERYADGNAERSELSATKATSGGPWNLFHLVSGRSSLTTDRAEMTLRYFSQEFGTPSQRFLVQTLIDILDDPQHPLILDLAWRTSTVIALAEAIYADRAWDRMPILADALEEAGCEDARVLDHCRTYPIHARGCWVVDLVLGKA